MSVSQIRYVALLRFTGHFVFCGTGDSCILQGVLYMLCQGWSPVRAAGSALYAAA